MTESLKDIHDIESHILDTIGLTRYCNLMLSSFLAFATRDLVDWTKIIREAKRNEVAGNVQDWVQSCQRITSPLNFLDSLWLWMSLPLLW